MASRSLKNDRRRPFARAGRRKASEKARLKDHAHTLSDFLVPTLSIECEPEAHAPSSSALIRAAIDRWILPNPLLISVDSRRICLTVNAYAASPHRRLKLDPGPWLASGRLLQQGGRNTGSNCIPATPIELSWGEVMSRRWPMRKSQDARRAINRRLARDVPAWNFAL